MKRILGYDFMKSTSLSGSTLACGYKSTLIFPSDPLTKVTYSSLAALFKNIRIGIAALIKRLHQLHVNAAKIKPGLADAQLSGYFAAAPNAYALYELAKEIEDGCGVLLITHSISQARRLADQIVVLHEGKLIEQGDAECVLSSPREEQTRRFLEFFGV